MIRTMNVSKFDEKGFECFTFKHVLDAISLSFCTEVAINHVIAEPARRTYPTHEKFQVCRCERRLKSSTDLFVACDNVVVHISGKLLF